MRKKKPIAGWADKETVLVAHLREEVKRLREAIVMANNRLESAILGDEPACKHCIDVAASYLQEALSVTNGTR